MSRWLSLVGIGEDGRDGLSQSAKDAIIRANFVIGGKRHLALAAPLASETMVWPSPIEAALPAIIERRGSPVVVLATGDPFHYGIGTMLSQHVASSEIASFPLPSAFSLAASRLCWSLQDVALVSLHGRNERELLRHLAPGRKILVLSWDGETPARVAKMLCENDLSISRLTVLEAMGGSRERVGETTAAAFASTDIDPLNTIAIECIGSNQPTLPRTCLPDDAFEHDGQITKQGIRAVTLSALAPRGGELLWDMGAGSGSIAIEWLRTDPRNRAVAIEEKAERASYIVGNAERLGVDLKIVSEKAPAACEGLPTPDAIFVGGGVSDPVLMQFAREVLRIGGRLVANAVTIEAQAQLTRLYNECGGELALLQHAQAVSIGRFSGWKPAMPIVQWRWIKRS